jgi:threonyl-tRNA synthetase
MIDSDRPDPAIDHRRLGRELDIFDSDPLIGAGLPYWLPAGAAARGAVEDYIREVERRAGYRHVYSPPLAHRELYEISGHWAHFSADMYPPMRIGGDSEESVLRPSLCPHHALIFNSRGRSYRELPLRIAELGGMYRAERSGVLGGLSRVRAIWLNDAHIFCAPDQVGDEVIAALALIEKAHKDLGIPRARLRLSLRGPGEKYAGNDDQWRDAAQCLREALRDKDFEEAPGEAAFYGPKIDVLVADPAGREVAISTVQIDFAQPDNFQLAYVDNQGRKSRPVMVHRSIIGSLERLFAHLIEVHQGAFPPWYAPVQVAVLPVGEAQQDQAHAFARRCVENGLRAEVAENGTLGARIRENRRVPALAIIGAKEQAAQSIQLRLRADQSAGPSHRTPEAQLQEPEAVTALQDLCRVPVNQS